MTDILDYALILTATPDSDAITDEIAASVFGLVKERAITSSRRWLAAREALWIDFTDSDHTDIGSLLAETKTIIENRPIDANIRVGALDYWDLDSRDISNRPFEGAFPKAKLLVADMDSTLIEQECIDEMAAMLGLKDQISAITERAMNGELDFEEALKARLGLLKGLDEATLQQVFDQRISLMPGAKTLVATMRANGAFTAIVSGGFTFFTSQVRAALGADADHSNTLGMENGTLTGDVIGPILGKDAKKSWLEHYTKERGLSRNDTMAVGDGANDLAMLQAAGLGVAFRAKPVVAAQAEASARHGDLTALLYLQGYARDEFVTG